MMSIFVLSYNFSLIKYLNLKLANGFQHRELKIKERIRELCGV